ncbi:unnamed protein product [Clonostachys rosea f. rosea IK726]|uniref:Uncharacterized protein n=1 Tax=Clonostachys rosea f. rosea IK726 TaxID=1349383 RepID=A0ACA9U509_BIOOC|nr:unnamed protein product [Clonostachys rosea f. rosea IK726]
MYQKQQKKTIEESMEYWRAEVAAAIAAEESAKKRKEDAVDKFLHFEAEFEKYGLTLSKRNTKDLTIYLQEKARKEEANNIIAERRAARAAAAGGGPSLLEAVSHFNSFEIRASEQW